uniref:Uncharacterized protein n=1 Tax=Siphoviridae sp. ctqPo10 TaxID=2827948 RepID=A0A8S5SWJ7_9CAUD|nr:MAG TPA: hypothetical protein [Siphoviridae sp. ctqPo10]
MKAFNVSHHCGHLLFRYPGTYTSIYCQLIPTMSNRLLA